METLTEEKAKVHIDGLPVEATVDEGCIRAAPVDVEEQMILGTKVEVCEQTIREGSPIQQALSGESSNSVYNIQNSSDGKKIFVGGLPSDLKIEEFSSFFERFGHITDAVIIPDAVTRRSRGFGFVTYDSKQSVSEVLKSSRYMIKDKNVEVKLAIPKHKINAAQQSIENRPIVNGDHNYTWFPYEIRPNIYGYHHHFNAFTLMPGMSRFSDAPQLYVNYITEFIGSSWVNRDIDFEEISRISGIRITKPPIINIEDGTSSPVVGDDQPSPSHMSTNNMTDRGSSSVDRPVGLLLIRTNFDGRCFCTLIISLLSLLF